MKRAAQRLFGGALSVSLLTACLDRAKDSDAGPGAADDAGDDAGAEAVDAVDAGSVPSGPCDGCDDQWAFSTSLSGCCAEQRCGLDASGLAPLLLTETSPRGCFSRDAAGVRSDECQVVFDRVDGSADGRYTLAGRGGTLALSACCSARGECGLSFARVELVLAAQSESADLGLGCVGLGELEQMLGDALYPLGKGRLDLPTTCSPDTGKLDPRR